MIRAFWRRGVANLRSRPWQTILLLLVVTIAATGITAGLDQQRGASDRWSDVFEEVNGAHLAIYSSADIPLEEIAAAPEVTETAGPFANFFGTLSASGSDTQVELRGVGPTLPTVATPLLSDGRWLTEGDSTGIVLDRAFALDRGIAPGDQVSFAIDGAAQQFEVVGLAIDTIDCLYPLCDPGRAWTLPSTIEAFAARSDRDARAISMVRLADPGNAPTFAAELQRRYPAAISGTVDWEDTRADVIVLNRFFGLFLSVFGAVLLFAGGLVIASTVTARMFAQYREIGLLKSIGFTPGSLVAMTLVEHLAIGVIGSILGWLAGAALAPSLQLRVAEVLDAGQPGLSLGSLLITALIVLALIAASTALPAWRAGRVPTSQAVSGVWASPRGHASLPARIAARAGVGPVGTTGINDAFARPFRATFTIATLTLSVVAGVVAIGFTSTIDAATDDPARVGNPWDVVALPDNLEPAELEAILDEAPAVSSWYAVAERRATDRFGALTARALSGDLASTEFVIGDGRMLAAADEAVVGHALLERLGIGVGDQTTLTVAGEEVTFTVVGWFATTEDSGEILLFDLDGLRAVEPDAAAGAWFVAANADSSAAELHDVLADATGGRATLRINESFDELDAFRVAFAIITLLVLAVGLSNLVASTLQMMQERTREVAVLKALGFTPAQVVISVAVGALALGMISVILGGLIAVPIYNVLIDALGVAIGVGPGFGVAPGGVAVLSLLVVIAALTAIFAAIAAQRVARATVAEVLRTE